MREILYGRNAARECLRARRRHVHKVLLADAVEPAAIIDEIVSLAGQTNLPVQKVSRKMLDDLVKGHQGVALETGRYSTVAVEDILGRTAFYCGVGPPGRPVDQLSVLRQARTANLTSRHTILLLGGQTVAFQRFQLGLQQPHRPLTSLLHP